jgi:hypothetical protein
MQASAAPTVPRAVSAFLGATILAMFIIATVHFAGDESSQVTPDQQTSLAYTAPPATTLDASRNCGNLIEGAQNLGAGIDSISLEVKQKVLECNAGDFYKSPKWKANIPNWINIDNVDKFKKQSTATVSTSSFDFASNNGYNIGVSVKATPAAAATELAKATPGTAGGDAKVGGTNSQTSNSGTNRERATIQDAMVEYRLTVNEFRALTPPKGKAALTPEFVAEMKAAVASNSPSAFSNFFETFGTHVLHQAYVGGVAKSTTTTIASNGGGGSKSSLSMSLSLSFPGGESGSAGYNQGSSGSHKASSKKVAADISCSGGDVSLCSTDIDKWAAKVKTQPTIIHTPEYPWSLKPIYTYISDAAASATVKKQMAMYLKDKYEQCPKPAKITKAYSQCDGVSCAWTKKWPTACTDTWKEARGKHWLNDGSMGNKCCCGDKFLKPLKSPTRGSTTPCGGSSHGLCKPSQKECACKGPQGKGAPGFTGEACEMYQVGMGAVDPTGNGQGPTRGGVAISNADIGKNAYYQVCDGNTPSRHAGITYSLNMGPNAYALKNGDDCPNEDTMVKLPPGVCLQTFMLYNGWGAYNTAAGWEAGNTVCGYGCSVGDYICGGKSGYTGTVNGFCAYRLTIQEGFQC